MSEPDEPMTEQEAKDIIWGGRPLMEPIQDDIEMSAEESDAIWREVAAEVCKAVGVLALTLVPARFTELVAECDQLIQENTELREQVERYRGAVRGVAGIRADCCGLGKDPLVWCIHDEARAALSEPKGELDG